MKEKGLSVKKKNLALALAMATTILTACQSSVSKEAYESLEARANQVETERDNWKKSFEDLNTSLEESKELASTDHKSKSADFNKHEAVSTEALPDFLQNDQKALNDMFSAAGVAFIDADIDTKDLAFSWFENYDKTDSDEGKQNSGFRIDLVFETSLRKLSCILYRFDNSGEWTFLGIKDYKSPHWYHINSGMGLNVPLYDYKTDTLKE